MAQIEFHSGLAPQIVGNWVLLPLEERYPESTNLDLMTKRAMNGTP